MLIRERVSGIAALSALHLIRKKDPLMASLHPFAHANTLAAYSKAQIDTFFLIKGKAVDPVLCFHIAHRSAVMDTKK